jgi:hypothetical protein
MKWYYNFIKCWPELHAVKPSGLSELRAKAASPECTDKYFAELDSILTKYDLKEKPHLVYNVDEKGINTGGVAILNGGYGCQKQIILAKFGKVLFSGI